MRIERLQRSTHKRWRFRPAHRLPVVAYCYYLCWRIAGSGGRCDPSGVRSAQLPQLGRGVDGRDLPGAEGIEHFLAHLVDGDAVYRRLLAVDLDPHLRVGDGEVTVHVA